MDIFKKLKELFIDSTVGLIKQYQAKSIDLVKIEAAAFYIRILQLLRRQALILTLLLFLVVMVAAGIVIVPLVLLALSPWPREVKLVITFLLGASDILIPLFLLTHFLSEKKWMEFTKSDELMESVMKNR